MHNFPSYFEDCPSTLMVSNMSSEPGNWFLCVCLGPQGGGSFFLCLCPVLNLYVTCLTSSV